jgi:hypothetical protein
VFLTFGIAKAEHYRCTEIETKIVAKIEVVILDEADQDGIEITSKSGVKTKHR